MKKQNFNIIICGVGGQGLITLLRILAEAGFLQGFDVKTSELHGLSQREGSVRTFIRFGEQVYSPLIPKGKADLILALEICEALRVADFANKRTVFIVNKRFISYFKGPSEKQILAKLNKVSKNVYFVNASKICQEKFNQEILAGVYLLGFAVVNDLILLKPDIILKAIKKIIPEKYFLINKKTFYLGQKYEG